MIRLAAPDDTPRLVALADATRIFRPGEAEALLGGVLEELHAGRLGNDHLALVWTDHDGFAVGWVYFAPTANADGVWDLWWIGVDPARQGEGVGGDLLRFVEDHVCGVDGRLLLIETSSQAAFEPTRRFYAKYGYVECGRVPDFYADGDDKIIYAKRMAAR